MLEGDTGSLTPGSPCSTLPYTVEYPHILVTEDT